MTTQFYTPTDASAILASSLPAQPVVLTFPPGFFVARAAIKTPQVKAPEKDRHSGYAVWVESSYAQLASELELKIRFLSNTALRVFNVLVLKARTFGDKAGKVWCSRKTLAEICGRSVDSWDEGVNQLIEFKMIEKIARKDFFGDDDTNEYLLLPPSRWNFGSRENSATPPKKSGPVAEKTRPKQKEAFKKNFSKQQQTPLRVENVVASSTPSNAPTPDALQVRLEAQGVKPPVAAWLARDFPERVALQLAWLDARNPDNRPATLVCAIKDNWEAPHRRGVEKTVRVPERANAGMYQEYVSQVPKNAPETPAVVADMERTDDILADARDVLAPEPTEEELSVAAREVFDSLPDAERDTLTRRVESLMPPFLRGPAQRSSHGYKLSFNKELRSILLNQHRSAVEGKLATQHKARGNNPSHNPQ